MICPLAYKKVRLAIVFGELFILMEFSLTHAPFSSTTKHEPAPFIQQRLLSKQLLGVCLFKLISRCENMMRE